MEAMHAILLFALPLLQQETTTAFTSGTGLEWMVVASVLVPMALLMVLAYFSKSHSV
jgi:hypothetical protein